MKAKVSNTNFAAIRLNLVAFLQNISVLLFKTRPSIRTEEFLNKVYSPRTFKMVRGGEALIVKQKKVRFISFRTFELVGLDGSQVEVHPDRKLDPFEFGINHGRLVAKLQTTDREFYMSVQDFLEHLKSGDFVFVDFGE